MEIGIRGDRFDLRGAPAVATYRYTYISQASDPSRCVAELG